MEKLESNGSSTETWGIPTRFTNPALVDKICYFTIVGQMIIKGSPLKILKNWNEQTAFNRHNTKPCGIRVSFTHLFVLVDIIHTSFYNCWWHTHAFAPSHNNRTPSTSNRTHEIDDHHMAALQDEKYFFIFTECKSNHLKKHI